MLDTTMNRRGFVKLAAATVAMAAASEGLITQPALAETATPAAGDVKRIRSCCRACGKMECGVWVTVEDGKAGASRRRQQRPAVAWQLLHEIPVFRAGGPIIPTVCAIP